MIVSDLSAIELSRRLAGSGVRLRTGPVIALVQSPLPSVGEGIALHYSDHRLAEPEEFADFHVRVGPPPNIRRWLRPQALFYFDGKLPFNPLPSEQAFPMLEWGLNWCVSANSHQYLIIHSAVIEKQGRAVILPAPPGSGKSTLCAGLVTRGWRLLSDELTLIEAESGNIVPLARPVSLKNASIDIIRRFSPQAVLGPTVHDTTKGSIAHMKPPVESVRRSAEGARPGWVILPRYEAGTAARLKTLGKARAFMQLANNAFNYSLHGRRGFEVLAGLIDNCGCYEFAYGNLEEAVTVFDDLSRTG